MMKYSVNHSWKFDQWRLAFMAGFLQTVAAVMIEIVNWTSIVTQFEIIDIVMKFMSLLIIMSFGTIFFVAYDEEDWKKIITDKMYDRFLLIQMTTSSLAKGK